MELPAHRGHLMGAEADGLADEVCHGPHGAGQAQ
jgi:hypothetical protein